MNRSVNSNVSLQPFPQLSMFRKLLTKISLAPLENLEIMKNSTLMGDPFMVKNKP